jgi:hypothetical protein
VQPAASATAAAASTTLRMTDVDRFIVPPEVCRVYVGMLPTRVRLRTRGTNRACW